MFKKITCALVASALAALALAISPAYPASMWDVGDKLATKEAKMKIAGKTEAQAKACTNKAWKIADEMCKSGLCSIVDALNSLLDNKEHASAIEECRDREAEYLYEQVPREWQERLATGSASFRALLCSPLRQAHSGDGKPTISPSPYRCALSEEHPCQPPMNSIARRSISTQGGTSRFETQCCNVLQCSNSFKRGVRLPPSFGGLARLPGTQVPIRSASQTSSAAPSGGHRLPGPVVPGL